MARSKRTIQELAYEKLRHSLAKLPQQRILEVGAGSGQLSQRLAAEGALVSALDLKKPPHLDHPKAQFIRHDLTFGTLPFEDASFDCVVSTEVIEHMKAPFLLLGSMVRVLRPGGTLILTMPNYWNLKYRVRYLLTGNMQIPRAHDIGIKAEYLAGYAPHINTLTWPTLCAVLTWEGCEGFCLDSSKDFRWYRKFVYLPVYLSIKLNQILTSRHEATQLLLAETCTRKVLFGSRHVLIACRRCRPFSSQDELLLEHGNLNRAEPSIP